MKRLIPILIPTIVTAPLFGIALSQSNEEDNVEYVDVPGAEYEVSYDTIFVLGKQKTPANKMIVEFENIMTNGIETGPREYKMSKNAHEFIKSFEKCKLTAYHIKGEKHNTIGWGHYLQEKHEQGIKKISQARADELFAQDVAWVDKAVTDMLNDVNPNYKWPQGIVDGLGSLVYNCGERGVRTTEFYRRLQNCRFENGKINKSDIDYTLAAVKTTRCSKPGHYKRRIGEYEMMCENFS